MFIAARIVLHQVAGDQDGVAGREVTRGVGERALKGFERVHATQRSRGVAEKVWIGKLDDSNGTHSIELYKHETMRRVMRVTPLFIAL
jgi:hypothetical protein